MIRPIVTIAAIMITLASCSNDGNGSGSGDSTVPATSAGGDITDTTGGTSTNPNRMDNMQTSPTDSLSDTMNRRPMRDSTK